MQRNAAVVVVVVVVVVVGRHCILGPERAEAAVVAAEASEGRVGLKIGGSPRLHAGRHTQTKRTTGTNRIRQCQYRPTRRPPGSAVTPCVGHVCSEKP